MVTLATKRICIFCLQDFRDFIDFKGLESNEVENVETASKKLNRCVMLTHNIITINIIINVLNWSKLVAWIALLFSQYITALSLCLHAPDYLASRSSFSLPCLPQRKSPQLIEMKWDENKQVALWENPQISGKLPKVPTAKIVLNINHNWYSFLRPKRHILLTFMFWHMANLSLSLRFR